MHQEEARNSAREGALLGVIPTVDNINLTQGQAAMRPLASGLLQKLMLVCV